MAEGKSNTGLWIAVVVLVLMLGGCGLVNMALSVAVFAPATELSADYPVDEMPDLTEIWSYGSGDQTKVARIALDGVIMRGGNERLFGYEPDMVVSILQQIRVATNDEEVKAILLEVNSPGGAVTPSDEIYMALKKFKAEDEDRKVVVFIRDLGASGAYYAAMAGDYIIAEPTAIVGSVGVLMQALNMKGLGEKIGLSSVTIKSGDNKDMLNPFEEVNPEHVAMLQSMVDSMQERFASIVQEARGFENRDMLDGRVLTADDALANGFIDQVGYWDDAAAMTTQLLDVEGIYMIRYSQRRGFLEMLMEAKTPNLPNLTTLEQSPRFMYLWQP